MKIELRNINYNAEQSDETRAFTASLYINRQKTADVHNSGVGLPTQYLPINDRKKTLILKAEDYCQSIPSDSPGKTMNLRRFIDNLFELYLEDKRVKDFRKGVAKFQTKGLVYGKPDHHCWSFEFALPIKELLRRPGGPASLLRCLSEDILPVLKEDEKILNTNLPEKLLKDAGLHKHQYVATSTIKLGRKIKH